MRQSVLRDNRRYPLIMAHRGDPTCAIENTLSSISSAVQLGVDVVEIDIRMTRDGKLVLFHDETLERLTGIGKPVEAMVLDEIQQIRLGSESEPDEQREENQMFLHRIPSLDQVFQHFPRTKFNMDIKSENPKAPEILADIISQYNKEQEVIVASFHAKQISYFREMCPEIVTAAHPNEVYRFLFGSKLRLLSLLARNTEYDALQVPPKQGPITVVDKRFLAEAHKRDIEVHVWTINEESEMERLTMLGVDGIFTDYPEKMFNVLNQLG
ncbi:MAG: hypothetical protein GF309_16010 [Candidatus Lokiarchaeota archaeon]|nr:hypothetical protein [Candidatus Lokiarchaeota archaeon]